MKAAAARRVAEAQAFAAYERYAPPNGDGPVDILAALARLVAEVTRFEEFAHSRLTALSAEQWTSFDPRTAAEVRMFEAAAARAGRLLVEVIRLGLDARRQEMTEQDGADIATVLRGALTRLGVDPGEVEVRAAVHAELLALVAARRRSDNG